MNSFTSDVWNVSVGTTQPPNTSTSITDGVGGTLYLDSRMTTHNVLHHNFVYDSSNPAIIKSGFLIFFAILGFTGNGVTLATIRRTSKLRTKTYALLFSLTVSDLLIEFTICWYVAIQFVTFVFSENPCSYILLIAIMAYPQRVPLGVTLMHVGLISIERYIAIVHALHYERLITDKTIKMMIAFGWIFPMASTSVYLTFINRINYQTCTIVASVLQMTINDICFIMFIIGVTVVLNVRILLVALRQRAKINAEVS